MSSGFAIKMTGQKQVFDAIGKLPEKLTRKVLSPAVRAAAGPVTKAARARIKAQGLIETKSLYRSIGVKVKSDKRGAWAGIGPREGFATKHNGQNRDPRFYAHLLEMGTSKITKKPFIRPALDSTTSQQLGEFVKKASQKMNTL